MKALYDLTPWALKRQVEVLSHGRDIADARLDELEEGLRRVQSELAELDARRMAEAESRLDGAEESLASVGDEAARLRDVVVPAMVDRSDALLERIAAEVEELGSLVERMLRHEPLPVVGGGAVDEARLAAALADVQPALLESFRGPETEIRHRLDHYLDALREGGPVLDLGCGRGELLLLLREAGIEAVGIEADESVAETARRRGLQVLVGDALSVLETLPDSSRGTVTAIHLFEHLEPEVLLAVLAQVRRVLRPAGRIIVESPNPHSLRVGASLYWVDPTHRRPLMPETLELYLKTSGFEVEGNELLHPFPADQLFADTPDPAPAEPAVAAVAARLDRLHRRLDDLINGPRDFAVWARTSGREAG
jgi:O-antigen chain-terminating methyltransferase